MTTTTEPSRGNLTNDIVDTSVRKQQQQRSDSAADDAASDPQSFSGRQFGSISDERAAADRAIDEADARAAAPSQLPYRTPTQPPAPAPAVPEPGAPTHYDNLHAGGWTPAEIAARAVVDLESISITPSGLALVVGDTKQMAGHGIVKGDPAKREINQSLTWTSDRPSVAAVTGAGLVTAVAPGTATLNATNGTRTANVTVAVTAPVTAARP